MTRMCKPEFKPEHTNALYIDNHSLKTAGKLEW